MVVSYQQLFSYNLKQKLIAWHFAIWVLYHLASSSLASYAYIGAGTAGYLAIALMYFLVFQLRNVSNRQFLKSKRTEDFFLCLLLVVVVGDALEINCQCLSYVTSEI